MSQALVTVVAPLPPAARPQVLAMIEALGNPAAPEIAAALDRLDGDDGVHFVSLHAIPASAGDRVHLVLEFTADGTEPQALARIVDRIGPSLVPLFAHAADWRDGTVLLRYLLAHRVKIGQGWFSTPGLAFAGTPGTSVGRIRREAALAQRLAGLVGAQPAGLRPIERLRQARALLTQDPRFVWALETPTAPLPVPGPDARSPLKLIPLLLIGFTRLYLWPVVLAVAALAAALLWHLWPQIVVAAVATSLFVLICAGLVIAALVFAYIHLRRQEESDWTSDRVIDRATLGQIRARENRGAQNHMVSATVIKPGPLRQFTLRLIFWIIGTFAARIFKPGFLETIGTIHFARWVTMPGTRDLIFFSNYGGSWESYLEDFITQAHRGLTGVWSNTVGFPKTESLVLKGATDGERFKRYARASMLPTPFWYGAYPTLTTANVRLNDGIRRGFAGAYTDEEAIDWLALFGSALRPAEKLESSQIQSVVFGGLGFMPYGECLIATLGDDQAAARGWLAAIAPEIAWDDGRRLDRPAVLTLALGPRALDRLGLPADAIESFPAAFVDGMTAAGRDRILGDTGANAAPGWWWGADAADAALLVYGRDDACVAQLADRIAGLCDDHGQHVVRRIPLRDIPAEKADRKEPFGYLDGVSQPVIRGTYRAARVPDPIHLVEPGEFILGYPDNRGNVPPGPALSPLDDPEAMLPISADCHAFGRSIVEGPRQLGRNGSFLVLRQLEQDVDAFHGYCAGEAARLAGRLPEPYRIVPEFVGAKLVGRWTDGSSLVRNPYRSASDVAADPHVPTPGPVVRAATNPAAATSIAAAPAVARTAHARAHDDNDFLFGTDDPEALRCPFGAHVRRANPRDSLQPGSSEQVSISNRHRILRIGRQYAPQDGQKPGLLFMCLNADIERQFEFVQQTWLTSPAFHGLANEVDPLMGDGGDGLNGFTVPTRDGPVRLSPLRQFVTMRGGGYFFLPGKRLVQFLAR